MGQLQNLPIVSLLLKKVNKACMYSAGTGQKSFLYVTIRHEGLILRALTPQDARMLSDLYVENLSHLRRFLAWAHQPLTVAGEIERLSKLQADYFSQKDCHWGIFLPHAKDLVGVINIWQPESTKNSHIREIGYFIAEPFLQRGIATLATQIVATCGFELLGSDRIEIRCNEENEASRRVIEKCGFHFEGKMRNFSPSPTAEMIQNGYCQNRESRLYSLIPEDIEKLSWYEELVTSLSVSDLFGNERPLRR
jgi:RimJ/RimL family protein N-acetyltransferase